MFRQLSQAGAKLANLVLPHQCVVCRNFAESTGLCARCWRGLSAIAAPVCRRCGLPLGHTLSEPICASCFTAPPPLAAIRAALHYNDSSRKLILAFKHGDALQL
ncbi:MAG TPA: amidophosphoribosyltransferase, partial [Alphaproteobacteria bacterium]|nr:amidophosphoribosyltransferase [Alphaproteobacteria bacterium]